MVTVGFVALVVIAVSASLFMAWALGANSNSPPFAPAIGANAISTMRAAFLIGILATAGAITQGGSISETVGSHLIEGVTITPLAATAGLLMAGTYMILGVYTGYPIPAAFATTGAMVGVGLSLSGSSIGVTRFNTVTIPSDIAVTACSIAACWWGTFTSGTSTSSDGSASDVRRPA